LVQILQVLFAENFRCWLVTRHTMDPRTGLSMIQFMDDNVSDVVLNDACNLGALDELVEGDEEVGVADLKSEKLRSEKKLRKTLRLQKTLMIAKPCIYRFEDDAYTSALLILMKPGKCSTNCLKITLVVMMIVVCLVQVVTTRSLQRSIGAHRDGRSVVGRKWQSNGFINPADAEIVCGSFSNSVAHQEDESGDMVDDWTRSPRGDTWVKDGSFLQKTICRLQSLSPTNISFYPFLVGIVAWTIAFLVEVKSVFLLWHAALVIVPTDRVSIEPDLEDQSMMYVMGLSRSLKFFVVIIGILRLSVAVYLYIVGCSMLHQTLTISDMILNSVAPVFILELDTFVSKALRLFTYDPFNSESVAIKDSPWKSSSDVTNGLGMILVVMIVAGLFECNYYFVVVDLEFSYDLFAKICPDMTTMFLGETGGGEMKYQEFVVWAKKYSSCEVC